MSFASICRFSQCVQLAAPSQAIASSQNYVAVPGPRGSRSIHIFERDSVQLSSVCESPMILSGSHDSDVTALAFSASLENGEIWLCSCSRELIVWYSMRDVKANHQARRHTAGRALDLISLLNTHVNNQPVVQDQLDDDAGYASTDAGLIRAPGISPVDFCCFDSSGRLNALSIESKVIIVSVETGKLAAVLDGHIARVNACAFCTHQTDLFITASEDRTFMVWNMSSRSLVYRSSILSAAPLLSLALDPKLPRVAIGSADGKLRIFDLEHPAFRCLQTLDVDAWLRREESKQIELQKSQAAVASAADNKVISSKKMWKNEYDPMSMRAIDAAANEIIGSSNATTESNDIGRPLLSLSFIYHSDTSSLVGSTQSRALSSASVPSPLLVMTSYSLLLIDTATCSVQGSVWFTQEQMLTMQRKAFHQLSAIDQIGFVGNATFSERRSRVDIVIASAFAPQLSLIELDFAPKSSLSGLPAVDESDQSDDDTSSVTFDDGSDDETNASDLASISVFARDMDEWSQDSPLRNASFVAAQPQDKSTGKKSKGVVQSKPVTFHSRVKSSGYGSVAPVRTMFGKKLPVKPKAKPVSPDERSYPVDCDMLNNFQKQHSVLPAPLHGGAILKASYSHDATRVLSCSMDGTARITKLPIAKHKGDGVQLVGHSGPVRDACFSCDSSLVATASADRTVRVWRGQGAEAAMVISNMVQNRSSVATATSSSVSDVASNSPFPSEIGGVRFFFKDKFILTSCRNRLSMFKYQLDDNNDQTIKSLQNRCKYKLVYAHEPKAQSVTAIEAINIFQSSLILCATSNRAVEAIDAAVGTTIRRIADAHTKSVNMLRMNGGSAYASLTDDQHQLFLTAAADNCIKLWDLRVSQCVRRFEGHLNRQQPVGASFSPCMRYVASGSEDKAAYLFDIGTAAPVERLSGHTDVVSDVAFSPLYPQLLTTCFDAKLRFFSDSS